MTHFQCLTMLIISSLFLNTSIKKNIKLTYEIENQGSQPSFDASVSGTDNCITASVYCKSNSIGLRTNYLYLIPRICKINVIRKTLIQRCCTIFFYQIVFHKKNSFLINIFINNGYSRYTNDNCIFSLLHQTFQKPTQAENATTHC